MTGGGVWDDMPMSQWPADGELPAPGDAAFDALLDRAPLPGDSASRLYQLAGVFGEVYAAPVASEPAAERQALAAFRAALGPPAAGTAPAGTAPAGPAQSWPDQSRPDQSRPDRSRPDRSRPDRSRPGRRGARRPRLSARVAAIGAAVVVSLGGAAAATAYTGALPGMLHRFAPHHPATPAGSPHQSPGQPTTESTSAAPGTRPGPCAAYQHALAAGRPGQQRKAFKKLVVAAGGAGNVTSYCAGVAEPQPTPGGQATHPAHPAHPTHPPHPTHPAHPSHPSHGHKQGSAG
jgi:hypothetical protein